MKKSIYQGMKDDLDEYFCYLVFFKGLQDHSIKVGKSGNLPVRFRDLQIANDKKIIGCYVLRSEYKFEIDAIEYIFKHLLMRLHLRGEYYQLNTITFELLDYILKLLNESQSQDPESSDDPAHPMFYSLTGIKPDSDFPYSYDWDEIFLHSNDFYFRRANTEGVVEKARISITDIEHEIKQSLSHL